MAFQYTFDSKGKTVGVFVPLREWEQIKHELLRRRSGNPGLKKKGILLGIEKGLKQVKQIEKGNLKSISLKQLLNEL
ncbi:MAG: hypothetical protein AABY93_01520 [Bacteroidota bacterium]